jgi:CRISPR-associated protein Csx17
MIYVHRLNGCAPAPLAHYLKALGVLRIVSDQLDPEARGFWEGEGFVLISSKTDKELVAFFLQRYKPTPILNPWGARSGFYPGSSERTSREVLQEIAKAPDERFSDFRIAIATTADTLAGVCGGQKPGDENTNGKRDLVQSLKSNLRGSASMWLDAVIATVDGEKGIEQPAILGTGGSEGSGSYAAAFMKAIRACLIDRRWDDTLSEVLFAKTPTPGTTWNESFGQFVPTGDASPWDLLLAFEGACIVRSSVVKRSEGQANRWSASPFYVAPIPSGFGSAARVDEFVLNKGKELPGRGEQWFPMWSSPATAREISNMFAEGRSLTSRSRSNADAHSMSRAVSRLGTARGIREFVRYGYLQRNNQATHFAVPLGRFVVPAQASPKLACLDDLDAWLPRLRRQARDKGAPARLAQAERRLGDAVFAVTQHPEEPARWQAILLSLADIEAIQVTGSGYVAGPIPRLRPAWVAAADDGSPELRLAVALALQAGRFDGNWVPLRHSGVRRHWLTLKLGRYATSGTSTQRRLQPGPDRVLQGRSGVDDAILLLMRRMVEASQHEVRQLSLRPARCAAATADDLARLLAGEVNLDRTFSLGRSLMALDAKAWAANPIAPQSSAPFDVPDDAWLAIRLATYSSTLPNGVRVPFDPAIIRRLDAADAAAAITLGLRKLRAVGVRAGVRMGNVPPATARLWAAALAFPINRRTAADFMARLDPRSLKEIHE